MGTIDAAKDVISIYKGLEPTNVTAKRVLVALDGTEPQATLVLVIGVLRQLGRVIWKRLDRRKFK